MMVKRKDEGNVNHTDTDEEENGLQPFISSDEKIG